MAARSSIDVGALLGKQLEAASPDLLRDLLKTMVEAVGRFDFTKTFHGDLDATGRGVMLSCGNPQTGAAGYVAIETVEGRLGDQSGGFALQQLGMMQHGSQTLHYEVVPGSGHGALASISGTFHLTVEEDGTHRYELEYEV